MSLTLLLAIITIIALIFASIHDIRFREVPDWLNFSLVAAALGIRAIFSVEQGWNILVSGVLGFALMFALAYLLYLTGQWGGGDSKLLMGLGAIIGIEYPLSVQSLQLFWFMLWLLFVGALYGLIWMLILTIKNHRRFFNTFLPKLKEQGFFHITAWAAAIIFLITNYFIPVLWPLALASLILFYLFIYLKTMEELFFVQEMPLNKVTEGDWLAEDLYHNHKLLLTKRTLEKADLVLLAKQKVSHLPIKVGLPFAPVFLMAFLCLQFWPNLLLFSLF